MSQRSHTEGASNSAGATILTFQPRSEAPAVDPDTLPFTAAERAALRRLLALGPARIVAMVRAMEHIHTACPTARRELSDVRLIE